MSEEEIDENEFSIELKVKVSPIHSVESGIARINSSYLEDLEEEMKMVTITNGDKEIVVKLVDDKLAREGIVILRSGDVEKLEVNAEDPVTIAPYKKLTDELKESWTKFRARFKKTGATEGDE